MVDAAVPDRMWMLEDVGRSLGAPQEVDHNWRRDVGEVDRNWRRDAGEVVRNWKTDV